LIDKKSTDLKRYLGRDKRDFRRHQGSRCSMARRPTQWRGRRGSMRSRDRSRRQS
jgi:hypothetical protein